VVELVDPEPATNGDLVLKRLLRPPPIRSSSRTGAAGVGSIGVTYSPQDDADADLLIHHADRTVYTAKHGQSRYVLFDVVDAAVTRHGARAWSESTLR
jgi:predicted signal transduction protein with EAL and GGDEF domain